jgi:hypothetical protein
VEDEEGSDEEDAADPTVTEAIVRYNIGMPVWMRSSLVVRASDCQCHSRNSPGFDPRILRHRGI